MPVPVAALRETVENNCTAPCGRHVENRQPQTIIRIWTFNISVGKIVHETERTLLIMKKQGTVQCGPLKMWYAVTQTVYQCTLK